ncbi:uncharacterized protein LOC112514110 [Cynara cardunculus var. scolymus]|uniref:uncharacterized protein LOC112514110 n=1 Tax=Cynara cardunculus var. scolymus TaxID=59895 RepID=UPI000D628FB2|nr:uncharacterized protein LOC112514110 [Cynara cardunculus var. scolymus]
MAKILSLINPKTTSDGASTNMAATTAFDTQNIDGIDLQVITVAVIMVSFVLPAQGVIESPCCDGVCIPSVPSEFQPVVGSIFTSLEDGIEMYRRYADIVGFDIRLSTQKTRKGGIVKLKYVVCHKHGKPKKRSVDSVEVDGHRRQVRNTNFKVTNCKASVRFKYIEVSQSSYRLYYFCLNHNHDLIDDADRILSSKSRQLSYDDKVMVHRSAMSNIGLVRAHKLQVCLKGGYDEVGSTVVDYKNFKRDLNNYIGDGDMRSSLKDSKDDIQMQIEPEKTSTSRGSSRRERKMALQQDVDKLRKRLTHEENVHKALEQALARPFGALHRLPPDLPPVTLELLAEVAVLEEEVIRLEDQVVQYRQNLYEEAIYISFYKRNLENSATDLQENCPSPLRPGDAFTSEMVKERVNELCTNPTTNKQQSPNPKTQRIKTLKRSPIDYMSSEKCLDQGDDSPNKISERILKCLMFIFAQMSSTSALRMTEMLPSLASCENPSTTDFKDPYDVFYKFENTDIGPYKYLYEVEATAINKNRTTISVFLSQRLKILLGKLGSVNLTSLTHQEKLAFWINIYNSCMMNAFLEHGIPETPERVIQLTQEAIINVGGHLLNAFNIEHYILRLPYHSKCVSEKGVKNDEITTRSIFGLELSEPLVTFALSCGSWSSPAVRVYTGSEVVNELEVAKRDYLLAAVGISSTKKSLTIPKRLDWYMLDFAKDMESFLDWICLQFPSEVGKVAMECLHREKTKPLSDCVRVGAYEFHFRYLLYK